MTSQLARARPVIDELRIAMRKPLSGLSKPWWYLICAAVFFFALALRIAHSRAGLPYIGGDTESYAISIYMNRRQSLDPQTFHYPSLIFMFGFFANLIGVKIANGLGRPLQVTNLQWNLEGWDWTISNPDLLLFNRALMGALGAVVCLLVIRIGEIASGRLTGVLAGVLLAANSQLTYYETRFTVNGIPVLFVTLSLLLSLMYLQQRRAIFLIGAFATAGLAGTSKYTAAVAVLAPLVAWVCTMKTERLPRQFTLLFSGWLAMFATFLLGTPFAIGNLSAFAFSIRMQNNIYFASGHYGADTSPGLEHLFGIAGDFVENWSLGLMILAIVGVVTLFVIRWRYALIVFAPFIIFTLYMATSAVNRHGSHSISYPAVALAVGIAVSLFAALLSLSKFKSLLVRLGFGALLAGALVPVGIEVAQGAQQIIRDWRYKDPRVSAINQLSSGSYGDRAIIATELRVHPAERQRLRGFSQIDVKPVEEILACEFESDQAILLPGVVTTWREAAARRIGEIKPPNEQNQQLQRLLQGAKVSWTAGTAETVLDYNFEDPKVVIVKGSDLDTCK